MDKLNVLSIRELRRYEPQMSLTGIGEQGQLKIKNARILVIGAGGKGTMALKNLITAGVGYIGISDDTLIQEDTLGRQSLYGDSDIGKQKAIVTKQYLRNRNEFTEIRVHNIRMDTQSLSRIINDYDILIDATNNNNTHLDILQSACEANKPVIFSNIYNNVGVVTILNNSFSAETNLSRLNKISKELNYGDSTTPVVIISSFTGIVIANEALKLILHIETPLKNNLLVINTNDYGFQIIPFS